MHQLEPNSVPLQAQARSKFKWVLALRDQLWWGLSQGAKTCAEFWLESCFRILMRFKKYSISSIQSDSLVTARFNLTRTDLPTHLVGSFATDDARFCPPSRISNPPWSSNTLSWVIRNWWCTVLPVLKDFKSSLASNTLSWVKYIELIRIQRIIIDKFAKAFTSNQNEIQGKSSRTFNADFA